MNVTDVASIANGMVTPSFIDIRTGERRPFGKRHNTLSYMSAEAMAAAFGGDLSYIPSRIGFIFGNSETCPVSTEISRTQDWDMLCEEVVMSSDESKVDILVVGFSFAPTLGCDKGGSKEDSSDSSGSGPDESDYAHILPGGSNAITFHAITNDSDYGVVTKDSVFSEGSYIYQCVLLGYDEKKYYVLARASLKHFDNGSSSGPDGRYLQKPKGFEVALDWTITFK